MKEKTNLTQDEMIFHKEIGFVINKQLHILLQTLFGEKHYVLVNCPFNEVAWPTTWNGKIIRRTMPFKMSKLHYNRWGFGRFLKVIVKPQLEVLTPRHRQIFKIFSSVAPN